MKKKLILIFVLLNVFGCTEKKCDHESFKNCSSSEVEQIKKKRIEEQVEKFKNYNPEEFK